MVHPLSRTPTGAPSTELEPLSPEYTPEYKAKEFANEPPEDSNLPLLKAIQRWPRVALYSLMLSTTIILWGFDMGIVGGVNSIPVFKEVFGAWSDEEAEYINPSNWLAIWNVASPIGVMIGAIAQGYLGDLLGRRMVLFIGSVLSAAAVVICYVSDLSPDINSRRGTFFAGKLVQGIAIGGINATTHTWMSESVPHQLRGSILAFFPIFQLVGQVIGAVVVQVQIPVDSATSYRVCFASQWPFSAVVAIVAWFLPESPTWLIRKGKIQKARHEHARLEGPMKNPLKKGASKGDYALPPNASLYNDFERLRQTLAKEKYTDQLPTSTQSADGEENASYLACFRGTDLRRTLIVVFCNYLPESFGSHLLGNANIFLQTIGHDESTSNLFQIIGTVLALLANIGSFYTLSHFRRRPLILWTLGTTGVLWLVIGIVSCLPAGAFVEWFLPITMMVIVVVAGLGCWPAAYVVAGETSALRLRAKTQGIGWFSSGIISSAFNFGMPYTYAEDAAHLQGKTGFIYVGIIAFGVVITWFFVPETKGKSPDEIDELYVKHAGSRF